jgi:hypothetical protein
LIPDGSASRLMGDSRFCREMQAHGTRKHSSVPQVRTGVDHHSRVVRLSVLQSGDRNIAGSGPCLACGECALSAGSDRCEKPEQRIYSLESLGINVVGLLKRYLDMELGWSTDGQHADFVCAVGAVFYRNESVGSCGTRLERARARRSLPEFGGNRASTFGPSTTAWPCKQSWVSTSHRSSRSCWGRSQAPFHGSFAYASPSPSCDRYSCDASRKRWLITEILGQEPPTYPEYRTVFMINLEFWNDDFSATYEPSNLTPLSPGRHWRQVPSLDMASWA